MNASQKEESLHFLCKCSFLEIYNETITDLLSLSDSNLHIREDIKQGVYVEGLVQEEVTNGTARPSSYLASLCSRWCCKRN